MKIKYILLLMIVAVLFATLTMASCGTTEDSEDTTTYESVAETETESVGGNDETTEIGESEGTTSMQEEVTTVGSGVAGYDRIMEDLGNFPVSFKYNGKNYSGFDGFTQSEKTVSDIENGKETTIVLKNPEINTDFLLVTRVFPAENAYEYVLYITNNTNENTGVFKDIEFNMTFEGQNPYLTGLEGDGGVSWYKEYERDLTKKKKLSFKSTSGRPTHHVFPYYNLAYGSDDRSSGVFIAVGWPGTWNTSFKTSGGAVEFSAGQNNIETYIAPGETLRTPLMAFVEYKGVPVAEQQNIWRHYFINDVMRKIDGQLPEMMSGFSTMSDGQTTDMIKLMLNIYKKNQIPLNTLWMDAGWYSGASGERVSWPSTGTLNMDTQRFPDGMSDIGKLCKDSGIEFLLWFEPENIRLDKDTFLKNTPEFKEEWLLSKTMDGTWLEGYLLDLGNKEAREWLVGKVSTVIDRAGIRIYRQDFNNDPAAAWDKNDKKDRKGMTENQYVQGYLAYWDALIEKYPYLMIDSCASGGGRNDLETMKRSVPLHYSDLFDGSGDANNLEKTRITQSLFAWFPYFKNESYSNTVYTTRINYAPYSLLKMPSVMDKNADWDALRRAYEEKAKVNDYFYNDYYKLTEYSADKNRWNGWEFFNKETNCGFAQIICNPECTDMTRTFKLYGLDENKEYKLKDLDGLVDVTATGRELMTEGFTVTVPEAPYCTIVMISQK